MPDQQLQRWALVEHRRDRSGDLVEQRVVDRLGRRFVGQHRATKLEKDTFNVMKFRVSGFEFPPFNVPTCQPSTFQPLFATAQALQLSVDRGQHH